MVAVTTVSVVFVLAFLLTSLLTNGLSAQVDPSFQVAGQPITTAHAAQVRQLALWQGHTKPAFGLSFSHDAMPQLWHDSVS